MTLLSLPVESVERRESSMDLRIEFPSHASVSAIGQIVAPKRIAAVAEDLVECEAVSTCASDSESVILFDDSKPQSTFVCGSSVVFRNLHPSVLASTIRDSLETFSIEGQVNCPSFHVGDGKGGLSEFNFGFCTVELSSSDEAVLLNFLIQSTGADGLLCGSPRTKSSEDELFLLPAPLTDTAED